MKDKGSGPTGLFSCLTNTLMCTKFKFALFKGSFGNFSSEVKLLSSTVYLEAVDLVQPLPTITLLTAVKTGNFLFTVDTSFGCSDNGLCKSALKYCHKGLKEHPDRNSSLVINTGFQYSSLRWLL